MSEARRPLFATRKLRCREISRELEVRIGTPHRAQKDWACRFQIAGLPGGNVRRAYGVDPLQALLCAIVAIRNSLVETGHRFEWVGGESRDGGIPRQIPEILGETFAKKIDVLIERTLARKLKSAKRRAERLGKLPPPERPRGL
jgi:hypothetical protein